MINCTCSPLWFYSGGVCRSGRTPRTHETQSQAKRRIFNGLGGCTPLFRGFQSCLCPSSYHRGMVLRVIVQSVTAESIGAKHEATSRIAQRKNRVIQSSCGATFGYITSEGRSLNNRLRPLMQRFGVSRTGAEVELCLLGSGHDRARMHHARTRGRGHARIVAPMLCSDSQLRTPTAWSWESGDQVANKTSYRSRKTR